MYESIKDLEIRTSRVFNLIFSILFNTISSCFSFFFFIIDLCFLIGAVIGQMFIPTAELVISTEIATN